MGNLDVGLVLSPYLGVCGVFSSVAGSWVLKSNTCEEHDLKCRCRLEVEDP